MGTDKATLLVDDVPLGRRAIDALRGAGIDEVVLIGGTSHHTDVLRADAIADDQPGEGPLPAVLTALRHAAGRGAVRVVVVACDLPHVGAGDVGRLLAAATRADASSIIMATADGVSAYPNGVWAVSAAPELAALVAAGERGFRAIPAHLVDHVEMGTAFIDADRPGDLPGARYPGKP